MRIAVNGLGRIGRCLLRALAETDRPGLELVALNGPAPTAQHLRLLRYDSVHGRFPGTIEAEGETLRFGRHRPVVSHEREPARLPWKELGIDLVLECSGRFTTRASLEAHLAAGARRVLLSAPAKDEVKTIVVGVNDAALDADDRMLSCGSCTTNALAPLLRVLHDAFGVRAGSMTTIHSFTGDQNLVDGSHPDPRRARAATLSIVPTATGAAHAIGLVLPELAGRIAGSALRVPTPNVSLIDLVVDLEHATDAAAVNLALREASRGTLAGILAVTEEPLVSIDLTGHPASSIVDLALTAVTGERLARVAAWYDNEWAFSCRMLDLAERIAGLRH